MTSVIIVAIFIPSIILLLTRSKAGTWALSLGAVLQAVSAMMHFRQASAVCMGPITQPSQLEPKTTLVLPQVFSLVVTVRPVFHTQGRWVGRR